MVPDVLGILKPVTCRTLSYPLSDLPKHAKLAALKLLAKA